MSPSSIARIRRPLVAGVVTAFALTIGMVDGLSAQERSNPRDITTMTRNVYVGAEIERVMLAPDFPTLLQEIIAVWQTVQSTDFPERAVALAGEIAAAQPDLVGLQEVSLWRSGPGDSLGPNPTPATDVEFDFLTILLDELAIHGAAYVPVVSQEQLDAELPLLLDPTTMAYMDLRLTDRDVILARADLPHGQMRVLRTDSGQFDTVLTVPVGGSGGPEVTIYRGWVAADVSMRGKVLRFLNTHLEDAVAAIQEMQAVELLDGPANVRTPLILVGDFNSDALGGPNTTNTYSILLAAGLVDAWADADPGTGGATWGHAADLQNPMPDLSERLDLVLFRGRFTCDDAYLVGEEIGDITPSGLWPSDHAGVVVALAPDRSFGRWWSSRWWR